MNTTPYQMAINNVAIYMAKHPAKVGASDILDAFTASFVLGVAFCKSKEGVITDIINAAKNEVEWLRAGGDSGDPF